MQVRYVLMGGIAVRVHGIPRPTYDVDFTIAIPRDRLSELCAAVQAQGYSVPEAYLSGWVDEVAGMPLVKFRLYLEGRGIDIDVFLAESASGLRPGRAVRCSHAAFEQGLYSASAYRR